LSLSGRTSGRQRASCVAQADSEKEKATSDLAYEQLDSYKPQVLRFFDYNDKLQAEVMRSIAVGLKLDEDFFDRKVRASSNR
jgi:isopenicillin N synthase-like dioxygenase